MPTPEEIAANREHLYESTSLRDDLNDDEATILLKWGEGQVEQIAQDFSDGFEQKCRFLRQLIKNINRFVGQREFNEYEGQQKYMKKISMYLPQLGWEAITEEQLFSVLPEDKADMNSNLQAILELLSPRVIEETSSDTPTEDAAALSGISPQETSEMVRADSNITENDAVSLENSNEHSINQSEIVHDAEIEDRYGEEEAE
jgi:hypothetical protein